MLKVCRNPKCPEYGHVEKDPDAKYCGHCGTELMEKEKNPPPPEQFDDFPRQKLKEIIKKYGTSVVNNQQRLEQIVRGSLGGYQREINILVLTLREGITAEILSSKEYMLDSELASYYTDLLVYDHSLIEEGARWAVESWTFALGITEEAKERGHDQKDKVDADKPVKEEAVSGKEHVSTSNVPKWIEAWEKEEKEKLKSTTLATKDSLRENTDKKKERKNSTAKTEVSDEPVYKRFNIKGLLIAGVIIYIIIFIFFILLNSL
ncbi:MAG: zinc ribbon domain-containing protein [Deltaproteobacteria bacterium]|uniref:Zinc ribbon domain-containing protein n=1 Tax=Candidatus Zymogenus saltonus TaxID=2844893 RepID=A0A9D8KFY9_9DELT|nr:zinc ribbon domain-containing protein [Candidatus Zymogenus saltonus]